MASISGVKVVKEANVWTWFLKGVRWDFRTTPTTGIWRNGISAMPRPHKARPLIVCDAVAYSLGWEAALAREPGDDADNGTGGGDAA